MNTRRLCVALASLTLVLANPLTAAVTCETVVRRGTLDPNNRPFTSYFLDDIGVNDAGDVLFVARAQGATPSLYRYPDGGTPEVVAALGQVAPTGQLFGKIDAVSIRNGGTLGFRASLTGGSQGVFVRDGGPIVKVAATSDASPAGGVFDRITAVSPVDEVTGPDIAFAATAKGGPAGVFFYDGTTTTLGTVAAVAGLDPDGRTFCSFGTVGLSDAVSAVFIATTDTDPGCSGTAFRSALYRYPVPAVVARQTDATPIGGTTFARFLAPPQVNAAGNVLYRASFTGVLAGEGVFFWNSGTTTTSVVLQRGDAAPGTTGFVNQIRRALLANDDSALVRADLRQGTARSGYFRYSPAGAALLLNTDPVPTDLFGPGARYTQLREFAASETPAKMAFIAKVKDTASPASKVGVLRCDVP